MLDEGRTRNVSSRPKIGGEHGISLFETFEGSHGVIFSGSGLTHTVSVDVLNTGVHDNFLGNLGCDLTGTSGSGDHADGHRAHLSLALNRDGVDTTDSGAPVTSADGDQVHLGVEEGALDGNLDFLADLDTEADVTLPITASDDSLESGPLTGLSLLLDGKDAHDLVSETILALASGIFDQSLDDLVFLDRNGVGVDLFKRADEAILDETAEFGERSPLFFAEASGATRTTSAASTAAASSAATSTGAETSSSFSTSISSTSSIASFSGGCVSWCSTHSC
jgi:hypothetical protein